MVEQLDGVARRDRVLRLEDDDLGEEGRGDRDGLRGRAKDRANAASERSRGRLRQAVQGAQGAQKERGETHLSWFASMAERYTVALEPASA